MILGGDNNVGKILLGLVVIGSIVGLIALFIYFMNDESTTANESTPAKPTGTNPAVSPAPLSEWAKSNNYISGPTQSNDGVDALKKYTKVANRYALALKPDYIKGSGEHSTKYYPESKEWQAVKPTAGALIFDNPGLCAAECDKYPKCKSFYWDSQQSPGACFLGTGFDPNTPDIGETSTTYYKP